MSLIVVTRLRLSDPSHLDEFLPVAVALLEEANTSPGNLGTDALGDANDTWWTCTAWENRTSMRRFVEGDLHASTMPRLDGWCCEAAFVAWEQDSVELPGWQEAHHRMVADGYSTDLTDASPVNASRQFPAPVGSQ